MISIVVNKTTMEVVRTSLDKYVDEEGLVDEILSFIGGDGLYVDYCEECGILDQVHGDPVICDICYQKRRVIREMKIVFDRYNTNYKTQGRTYRYKKFSKKLSRYLYLQAFKKFMSKL